MAPRAQTVAISKTRRPLSEFAVRVAKHIGLAKLSLCYLMTASALTAYVARRPALDSTALETIFCLFLLCLGSATLNNYQDREIDTQLGRTRGRPLARREISARAALIQAAALILAGTVGLCPRQRLAGSSADGLDRCRLLQRRLYAAQEEDLPGDHPRSRMRLATGPDGMDGGRRRAGVAKAVDTDRRLWRLATAPLLAGRSGQPGGLQEFRDSEHAAASLRPAVEAAGIRLGGGVRSF